MAPPPAARVSGGLVHDSANRRGQRSGRVAYVVLVGLTLVVAAWSRLAGLSGSLWHDEVVMIDRFVAGGPSTILFERYIANNHMLFSVLAWLSGVVAGPTESAFRFWSVVPGLGAVAVLMAVLWRAYGPLAAGASGVLLTVSPLHLDLVPQARGYGLAFLAAALMLAGAWQMTDRDARTGAWLLGVGGFVGIATLPVLVLPFLGQAVALAVRPVLRRRVALTVAVVGAVCLAWYLPVLSDLIEASGQEFGERLSWHGPVTGVRLVAESWFEVVPLELSTAQQLTIGLVGLVAACAILAWRDRWRLLDLLTPVLLTFTVLTVTRFFVLERFVSYLLIHLAALLAVALWHAVRVVVSERYEALAGLVILASLSLLLVPLARLAVTHHELPIENFKQAALIVDGLDPAAPVVVSSERPAGWRYYLGEDARFISVDEVEQVVCGAAGPIVYVEHPLFAPELDQACLRGRGAVDVTIPQRRRGVIRLWILHDEVVRQHNLTSG